MLVSSPDPGTRLSRPLRFSIDESFLSKSFWLRRAISSRSVWCCLCHSPLIWSMSACSSAMVLSLSASRALSSLIVTSATARICSTTESSALPRGALRAYSRDSPCSRSRLSASFRWRRTSASSLWVAVRSSASRSRSCRRCSASSRASLRLSICFSIISRSPAVAACSMPLMRPPTSALTLIFWFWSVPSESLPVLARRAVMRSCSRDTSSCSCLA
mmetsp:Transcript_28351/g.62304  ORF Transcript_28351/g.62304 Transcript_28351/m.62304 type:complete len:217 (+) Transcript_28351:2565-3215(+)